MNRPRRNTSWRFRGAWAGVVLVAALASGVSCWRAQRASVSELALPSELGVVFAAQQDLERSWIREHFAAEVVLARPDSSRPCAAGLGRGAVERAVAEALRLEDPAQSIRKLQGLVSRNRSSGLASLALAALSYEAGNVEGALQVAADHLRRPAVQADFERIHTSARGQRTGRVDPERARALLHLYFLQGTLQLERGARGDPALRPLRRAIATARYLASQDAGGLRSAGWGDVVRPAPGCSEGSLDARVLYSNLIVGYMRSPGYQGANLERELVPSRRGSGDVGELQALLVAILAHLRGGGGGGGGDAGGKGSGETGASRPELAWAILNAEEALSSSHHAAGGMLGVNTALLLEAVRDKLGPALQREVDAQIETLAEDARILARAAPKAHVAAWHRLALLSDIAQNRVRELPNLDRIANPAQAEVLRALRFTTASRDAQADWLQGPDEAVLDRAAVELGRTRSEAWRRAVHADLADALAREAVTRDPIDRGLILYAESLLPLGSEAPADLERAVAALDPDDRPGWLERFLARSSLVSLVLAVLAGSAVALLLALPGIWLDLQLDRRRALFTSFYRVEVDALEAVPRSASG